MKLYKDKETGKEVTIGAPGILLIIGLFSIFVSASVGIHKEKKAIKANQEQYDALKKDMDAAAKRLDDSVRIWTQRVK
jgi:hypothetical protein